MAVNRFTGALSDIWPENGNWSLGVFPTAGDGHDTTFDATSPNCRLFSINGCHNLIMTGYPGTFDTTGQTFTITGSVTLGGTILSTSSFWAHAGPGTLTSNGKLLGGFLSFQGSSATRTLVGNWSCATLRLGVTTGIVLNGNKIFAQSIQHQNNTQITGTTEIEIDRPDGTISSTTTGGFNVQLPITINTVGTVNIGNFRYGTGLFKRLSGTINHTGAIVVLQSCSFDMGGVALNAVSLASGVTVTCNSLLAGNTLALPNGNVSFNGVAGFSFSNVTNTTPTTSRVYTFKDGVTYLATNLTLNGTASNTITVQSSSATVKAILRVSGTQSVTYTNATRIDSSGGLTIFTSPGSVLTDTINWNIQSGMFPFFLQ